MSNLIETQIGYSTKISKQVLLSKYKEQISSLTVQTCIHDKTMSDVRRTFSSIISDVEAKAKIASYASDAAKKAKAFATALEVTRDKEQSELSLDAHHAVVRLDPRETYWGIGEKTDALKEVLETKQVSVEVTDKFVAKDTDRFSYSFSEIFDIDVDTKDLKKLAEMLEAYEANKELRYQICQLETKIAGIDAHMERIEAELLAKELQRTTAGQEVLALTQAILVEEEGVTLPMLDSK